VYCIGECKALVYDFMAGGDVDTLLRKYEALTVTWIVWEGALTVTWIMRPIGGVLHWGVQGPGVRLHGGGRRRHPAA